MYVVENSLRVLINVQKSQSSHILEHVTKFDSAKTSRIYSSSARAYPLSVLFEVSSALGGLAVLAWLFSMH